MPSVWHMEEGPDFAAIQASSRHGSRARYKSGCYCDACREANTAYHRRRREAQRVAPDPSVDIVETVGKWIGVIPTSSYRVTRRMITSPIWRSYEEARRGCF